MFVVGFAIFFVGVAFTCTHKCVSQSVCDKRMKMQGAKLDIDVDVWFGQNFIIYIKVVDFSFLHFRCLGPSCLFALIVISVIKVNVYISQIVFLIHGAKY